MRHDVIDRYSRLDSPVHRLPSGIKLAGTLILLLGTALAPGNSWGLFLSVALILGFVAAISRIPPSFLLLRMAMIEPFILGISVLSLLQPGGAAIFTRLVVRGTLCLFTIVLMTGTTPFSETIRVLRRIRVPGLLVTTMALMYRYVFVLVDETDRMGRARASRTFGRSRSSLWYDRAGIIARLFVRSTERAERIYAAMCARGWKT